MKICFDISSIVPMERRQFCYLLALFSLMIKITHLGGAPINDTDIDETGDNNTTVPQPDGDRNVTSDNSTMWTPPDGDRETWERCHGMSPESCKNMPEKLQKFRMLSQYKFSPFLAMNDIPAGQSASNTLPTVDGDIILTEDQIDSLIAQLSEDTDDSENSKETDASGIETRPGQGVEQVQNDTDTEPKLSRKKRGGLVNFMRFPTMKWLLPIYYKFDGGHDSSQQQFIRNGFQHWADNTCVRFTELDVKTSIPGSQIVVTNDNSRDEKCFSYVGRAGSGPQQLNLAPSCLNQFGIPPHEIGHALGLWHEHTRPDRDQFIRVINENMVSSYSSQFVKNNDIDTRGQPYDFSSAMHYSPLSASWNGRPSLVAINQLYQMNMGQRTGLSYGDIKIINMAYCQDTCKQPLWRGCERGGYQNPNKCDACICPDGFSGQFCEQVASAKNAICGGTTQLSQREDLVIKSPGYDIPKYYNSYQECSWLIKAPAGQKLRLDFLGEFGLYYSDISCAHWVEVKYKSSMEYEGARFCGYNTPNATIWSESNEMLVIFKSNYSGQFITAQRGFQARIQLESSNLVQPTGAARVETTTTTTTTTTTMKPTSTARLQNELPGSDCSSLDLAFLMDTSNNMELVDQRRVIVLIQNIVTQFQRGGTDLRIALARFTLTATQVVGLNDPFYTEGLFVVQPLAWRLMQHDTNTASGLNLIRTHILADARYRYNGGTGEYVPRVCVLITNGGSTVDRARTLAEADAARNAGIKLIVIAVGPTVNGSEASWIAGSDDGVIYAKDFADFDQTSNTPDIVKLTKDEICDNTQYGGTPQTLFQCSFEPGQGSDQLCGMIQDKTDQFDFRVETGKTPSDYTGPSAAYSGSYYIYIEASDQRPNDEARISVPRISTYTGEACVDFYYHMYGFHINTLKLVEIRSSYTRILMMRYKEMGNSWYRARVSVNLQPDMQLQFIASRGQEYSGDIALDMIKLTTGKCAR